MSNTEVYYGVLGRVTAHTEDREIDLGWARQQTVLAVLLLQMNRPVSVENIIDAVWGEQPPQDARRAVHTNISRLRRALWPAQDAGDRDEVLRTVEGGYLLAGIANHLDTVRFEQHLAAAGEHHRCGDLSAAAVAVDAALTLWRGEPFSGLSGPWIDAERARWCERRLAVIEIRAVIQLDRGEYAEVLGDLTCQVAEFPLRERLRELMIIALYRSGRQADAVQHYHHLRAQLAEELGVDPSPPLQRLYQRILAADPDLDGPTIHRDDPEQAAEPISVPHQLPPAPPEFTGRSTELASLTDALQAGAATALAVLTGAAGVGKSWLALHWLHHHLDRFPDGQIYVDMRSFGPSNGPLTVDVTLRELLYLLAGNPADVPGGRDAQVTLYRSLTASRRMVILLDNVQDPSQLIGLLPDNTTSCTVLITTRERLPSSIAKDACHLTVEALSDTEARTLLTHRAGAARLAAEPDTTREVITWCAGVPSMLDAVAAHFARHPDTPLRTLVGELRNTSGRLVTAVDSAVNHAVRTLAVRASAAGWRRVIERADQATGSVRRPAGRSIWPLPSAQFEILMTYLSSRMCRGLLEMLAFLECSGRSTQVQSDKDLLAEIFAQELANQLESADHRTETVAQAVWADLTESLRRQVRRLRTERAFAPDDLAYMSTLAQSQNRADGIPDLTRAIRDWATVAADRQRMTRAHNAIRVIADSARERYARHTMPHSREDHQIPIEEIYVTRTLRAMLADTKLHMTDDGLIDFVVAEDFPSMSSGDDEIPEKELADRRFVVVGNPGAGKSTFIRHLLYRLSMDTDSGGPVAPLVLELKDMPRLVNSYATILTEQLRMATQTELTIETVCDILTTGQATVVFDGLDEIGQLDERRSTVASIQAFCRRYPLVQTIVTSRQEGYASANLDSTVFPVYHLPDFTDEQVESYVRRWFQLTARIRQYDPSQRAASFLNDSAHVPDLRNNPLMLSLLCLLYEYEGYIPENRPAVYEQCAELLFERWDRIRRIPLYFRPNSQIRYLVQELAYHFFSRQPQGGETGRRLRLIVADYFERNVVGSDEAATTQAEEFLDYCSERAWLLTQVKVNEQGERQFGFTHRTFMEYFAACYIVRRCGDADELVERIRPMIMSGASDVVPQIAIQQFDIRRMSGIDECIVRLVLELPRSKNPAESNAYLAFALRSLQFLRPSPKVLRQLYDMALRIFGENIDLRLLRLLLDGPADARKELTLASRAAVEDATADTPLRLGSALATILAPVYRPGAAIHDADYIQRMLLANQGELQWLADIAPEVIAEMHRRGLLSALHHIGSDSA